MLAHLAADTAVLGALLKLHPGVLYSQPLAAPCAPPLLTLVDGPATPHLTFLPESASRGDWHYPMDLCGGVYRLKDIRRLVHVAAGAFGPSALSSPNMLEVHLNRALALAAPPLGNTLLCPASRLLCVVSVNRVQSDFAVPVLEASGGDVSSLVALAASNERADQGEQQGWDASAYAALPSLSVHVGALFIAPCPHPGPPSPHPGLGIEVSVLLPVRDGGRWIFSACASILTQTDVRLELVVVNDGSTDDTCSELERVRAAFPLSLMRVLSTSARGLVSALQMGLGECKAALVARMDADDVALPQRLARQVAFLAHNPDIVVLGTQAILMSEGGLGEGGLALVPTHPVLVQWELLTHRCAILHPSVMCRRDELLGCGGYVDAVAEDYALWLTLAHRCRPYPTLTLPFPTLLCDRVALMRSVQSAAEHDQPARLPAASAAAPLFEERIGEGAHQGVQRAAVECYAHPHQPG